MKPIRFTDSASLEGKPSDSVKDFFTNMDAGSGKTLRVTVAATHAGRVTRNNAIYLPDKMRQSVDSWLTPYPKPILEKAHDSGEPIGRAVSARYVDTSQDIRTAIADPTRVKDSTKVNMKLFDQFVAGKLDPRQTVDFVNDLLAQEIIKDRNYPGLGYIELTMDISDEEAIKKVLDGRYLTGSQGATTDSARCSICKKDWAIDGMCEHDPGEVYDDVTCVLVAGEFVYDEYIYCNKPADELSQVIRIGDSVSGETRTIKAGDASPIKSVILFDSVFKEESMLTKEQIAAILTDGVDKPDTEAISALADKVLTNITDNKTGFEDDEKAKAGVLALRDELTKEEEPNPLKVFWGDALEAIVGDDDSPIYASSLYVYAAQDSVDEKTVKDEALTYDERVALGKNRFAGPYLCHDKFHALVARYSVDGYKGDDKAAVAKMIERKCARLGVDEVKDEFDADYFDQFEDDQLKPMHDGLIAAFTERKLDVPVLETVAVTDEELKQKLAAAEKAVAEATTALADLQGEHETLENELADSHQALKDAKIEHIVVLNQISDEKLDDAKITTLRDDLSGKSLEDTGVALKDCLEKVDVASISEKLRSGTTGDPNTTVADPTLQQDQRAQYTPEEIADMQVEIAENFLHVRMTRSQAKADSYLARMEAKGILLDATKTQLNK